MQRSEEPIAGPRFVNGIWPRQLGAPVPLGVLKPLSSALRQQQQPSCLTEGSRGDDVPVKQVAFTEEGKDSEVEPALKSPEHRKEGGTRHHHLGLLVWNPMVSSRGTTSQLVLSCWSVFDLPLGRKRTGAGIFTKDEPGELLRTADVLSASASTSPRSAWRFRFRGHL